MKLKIIFILSCIVVCMSVKAQKYVIFERFKDINSTTVSSVYTLSQNEVSLSSGDTTLNIFNFHIRAKRNFIKYEVSTLSKVNSAEALVTIIPIVKVGESITLKKLTQSDLAKLDILSIQKLIDTTINDLNRYLINNNKNKPPLKSHHYGLVIKDGKEYYEVAQKVLLSQFCIENDTWYFPIEFKNGVLNTNVNSKQWDYNQLNKLIDEMAGVRGWYKNIMDRIYISKLDQQFGTNWPLLTYFEYPSGDVVSTTMKPVVLKDYHLGLGSFQYLNEVGVINCTLDYYLKGKLLFNQQPSLKIKSINSLSISEFKKTYNERIKAPHVGGDAIEIK